MRKQRLRYYAHLWKARKSPKIGTKFRGAWKEGSLRGVPKKGWKLVNQRDLAEVGATADDDVAKMMWSWITDPATVQE